MKITCKIKIMKFSIKVKLGLWAVLPFLTDESRLWRGGGGPAILGPPENRCYYWWGKQDGSTRLSATSRKSAEDGFWILFGYGVPLNVTEPYPPWGGAVSLPPQVAEVAVTACRCLLQG